MTDLSVVVPSRNEMFLNRTVEDLLAHSKGDTEVIVVLDGAWPDVAFVQDPRLHVVYLPESIGQRAATNLGARISNARWVCKVDAHCSFADGWDVELIRAGAELGRNVVQIPAQHNLHAFNRVCQKCGKVEYQGPMTVPCVACGETNWQREMVWQPRRGVRTTSWAFNGDLKFQYWGAFTKRPEGQGEITDTMSCLGACWFVDREWFFHEMGGLDEGHGSWGQMGTELSCVAWLSGGRVVTNHRTSYAHMFRTQGHDFGFPYPITGAEQEKAREYSRDVWFSNKRAGQVRPLRWLVEKFWPIAGWSQEQLDVLPRELHGGITGHTTECIDDGGVRRHAAPMRSGASAAKGVVYYSDCRIDCGIAQAVQRSIESSGLPIVSVALKPIHWGAAKNLVLCEERSYLTMFKQILAGLEAIDTEFVFFCEHDVLYHPSHFAFTPPNHTQVFYNQQVWKVNAETGQALHYLCSQTSGLCASRELLLEHYRKRVAIVEAQGFSRKMGFEPGTHRRSERVDDLTARTWMSEFPNVDIRHSHNLTPSRWKKEQFRDQRYTAGWTESDSVPGWGVTKGRFREFLQEAVGVQQAVA